ncbi:T9SS type B sorting domain-containing protein [Winogradskyella sp. A3E31]|uniref:T9SS type B sorting domain-containing protein n=1 Tax=Winogradskyella sp. A3E31 TaxID=3349637 RepID=UPI00398B5A66
MKNKNSILFLFLFVFSLVGIAQNLPPEISVTGNQLYCPMAPIPIVTSASISDPDPEDSSLSEIFVQISGGYQLGEDLLTLGGVNPNITALWSASEGELNLKGPATFEEFATAVENVFFQTTETVFTEDREFSINLSDGKYLPSTGHYYIFEEAPGISWSAARTAAENQTYFGIQGYLATLTSLEEAQFAGEQTSGTGWIGATDEEQEGLWKWVTGPEAGTAFWQGAVNGTPINNAFSFWNTGEPNNLGDEDYAHITDPSIGIDGSWNDLPLTSNANDPSNPYYPKGYIVEFGGLGNEPELNISANSIVRMPRLVSEEFSFCGGNNITISIASTTDEVFWYESETSTTAIYSGFDFETSLDSTTTFWLNPYQEFCSEGYNVRYPVTITINPLPDAEDITVIQCDDNIMGDGISTFNLSNYDDAITAGIMDNRSVTYFLDASLTSEIDTTNYTNQFNNQIVYARVENTQTGCMNSAEVTLRVNSSEGNVAVLEICDDELEDGIATFDLSEVDSQVLQGVSSDYETSYFETLNDAQLDVNELPANYSNTNPYNQTIFVRINDGFNCIGINEVELIVRPLPNLLDNKTVYYCLNEFPQTIRLSGGIVDDIPNNYYYNWSTGVTTIQIEVNTPGTYTVDVTEVDGCTNSRTITVLPSSSAVVESINITDASDNNSIEVQVSGSGEYEYALNNPNGPFQESNTFLNVTSGTHTIYIRDLNGCAITEEEVIVLGFPKYFTPNGDGNHDVWLINGLASDAFQGSILKIFNRHGKLLEVLSASKPSWDGTYNDNLMPSDDYWFLVELADGRTITDHFALKR